MHAKRQKKESYGSFPSHEEKGPAFSKISRSDPAYRGCCLAVRPSARDHKTIAAKSKLRLLQPPSSFAPDKQALSAIHFLLSRQKHSCLTSMTKAPALFSFHSNKFSSAIPVFRIKITYIFLPVYLIFTFIFYDCLKQ